MSSAAPAPRRFTFGPYEAELHSGELRKNGTRIRLQAQPFQLLAMLLQRPGELVTREEICTKLWPADTFVDFDHSLGTAIKKSVRFSMIPPQSHALSRPFLAGGIVSSRQLLLSSRIRFHRHCCLRRRSGLGPPTDLAMQLSEPVSPSRCFLPH